ncbi:Uncharacterized protein Rs2_46386 [Raphanus sativus]|nr:Uncharacterized protein Rs2_46386 [Raphanus sativus]
MDLKPPLQNVIDDVAQPLKNNPSSSKTNHPTATPDPRWPSKCRWSMESPPPEKSTGTESVVGSELSFTLPVLSNELEVAGNIASENKTEEKNSAVEPLLEVAGGNVTEITSQPENADDRNTCAPLSSSPQSTGLPPITTTSPDTPDTSAGSDPPELEKVLAQSTVASDLVLQAGISESKLDSTEEAGEELFVQTLKPSSVLLQSQPSVEPKDPSTPVNNLTYSKVHIANGSNSLFTTSPLADSQSAPAETTTMEDIPSPIIVPEANLVSTDN